ncbi:hypothetical protein GPJ56_009902 [Histomonas meleagridis]|uniref:uncharacterized protein n=1 Tax=Histomonas meleagridis TaxID=135588 RepID=UPI00355A848E|nr:hypothetical protein GPJ56_009902 [Histomonas meleagridis]KAH0802791.1 hypothetical protein GO595_004298 [Histomonas meleagridis]
MSCNRYCYQRYHWFNARSFLFKVGADFIMFNTDVFNKTNSSFFDAIWHTANNSFLLYLVSEPNSRFAIRQAAASFVHFHRLMNSSTTSLMDYALSRLVSAIMPNTKMFSSNSSKTRAFKRIMLALKRNGGVYEDMFNIASSFARLNFNYSTLLKQKPFKKTNVSDIRTISSDNAKKLISKELNLEIPDFPKEPTEVSGPFSMYDVNLPGIGPVTISIIPEKVARMRRFDLFPFKVIRTALSPFSFFRPEMSLFDALIDRLDVTVEKEAKARSQLLSKLGVNMSLKGSRLFTQARRASPHLYIPAPLPDYVSKHVMVTDVQYHNKLQKTSTSITSNLILFTTNLARRFNTILPDLSFSNIRKENNKISLAQFSSLTELEDKHCISNLGKLCAGILMNSESEVINSAKEFGIKKKNAVKAMKDAHPFLNMTRQMMPKNAKLVITSAETIGALSSHVAGSTEKTKRAAMSFVENVNSLFSNPLFRFLNE